MANELGHGITMEIEGNIIHPMDMGIINNLKTLYHSKLVNYILEALQENLLTSSTGKEVSAKTDVLQAVQLIASSC
jgi:hypothetical protein